MHSTSVCDKNEAKNRVFYRIKTPAQIMLIGPSQCGKSTLLLKLIYQLNNTLDKDITNIIYCAPCSKVTDSKYVEKLQDICKLKDKKLHIYENPPSIDTIQNIFSKQDVLLILDDVTGFKESDLNLGELSSIHAHHSNITCIYSLQNPFQKSKIDLTTISRNLTFRIIFYQTNDWLMYKTLNSKIFPDKKNFLLHCLEKARKRGINYICVDTNPHTTLERRFICMTALLEGGPLFFDLQS